MAETVEKVGAGGAAPAAEGGEARRRVLTVAVSTVLLEAGYSAVDRAALETLAEILQCFLSEVGNSAKNYCELAGRVEPMLGDVIVALVNMGISLRGLERYASRPNRHVIQPPQQATTPRTPAMLSAGTKAKPAPNIPYHLPALPDPHAYIRTPTHKQPVTEYEAIREKAASQKRDIERALTRFLAKTSDTLNLFNTEENTVFPLIACKPTFPAYLPCLLPTDQVFDFEELEYHFQVANRTEDLPVEKKGPFYGTFLINMVKVYALAVLYKGLNSASLLKAAFDLQSFSFFQRGSVQEFMTFISKTIVERTQVAARQSVKEGEYMCQVYVRSDNLAGVLISDQEYPNRVAHTLITRILDDFTTKVPQNLWATGNETTVEFPVLPQYLAKYQNPKEADALTKIQDDLDETKIILHDTIKAVLERGEKLDDLVAKSDSLSMNSKAFYKTAKKTNSCCNF